MSLNLLTAFDGSTVRQFDCSAVLVKPNCRTAERLLVS